MFSSQERKKPFNGFMGLTINFTELQIKLCGSVYLQRLRIVERHFFESISLMAMNVFGSFIGL